VGAVPEWWGDFRKLFHAQTIFKKCP
jgi:hypothetical protein